MEGVFSHEALFYESEDHFLSTVVPFVQQGIADGDLVSLNLGSFFDELVRIEVGDDPMLRVGDELAYTVPVAVLNHNQRQIRQEIASGATGFRCVGAVDFAPERVRWQDWVRFESLVNHVLSTYNFKGLCVYDVRTSDPRVVAGVRRAHLGLHDAVGYTAENRAYVGPVEFMGLAEYAPHPDPLETRQPELDSVDVTDLDSLRFDVNLVIVGTELHRRVVTDFSYAVNEVVTNALLHGRRPVRVRVWTSAREIACAVTDQGPGNPDPLSGYRLASAGTEATDTLGLWAARQLCDEIHYGHDANGFTVRLSVRRPRTTPAVANSAQ